MKRSLLVWQCAGFIASVALGSLLHFLYDFTNKARWAAIFSSTNDSTFEHMKLIFWPMLLFAVIQRFFFRDRCDFWRIKLCGILIALTLIPTLFYTYNGVIGKSPDFINIAIFVISALAAYVYETREFKNESATCKSSKLALPTLCVIAILFIAFTFAPPEINIFKDPITNTYGI